jgi:DNA-binding CsgD family transcriptional regulator
MGSMASGSRGWLDREVWRAASDLAEAVNDRTLPTSPTSPTAANRLGQIAMEVIDRMVGCDLGSILVAAPGEPWTVAGEIDDNRSLAESYWRYAAEMSPEEMRRMAEPFARAEDIFEGRRRETLGVFREFLAPRGLREVLVANWLADGRVYGMGVTRRRGPFTERERGRLRALFPHLRAALRAAALLNDAPADYPGAGAGGPWGLTPGQERTMALAVRGMTNEEIAGLLGISSNTVRNVLVGVFEKAGVSSRTELAFAARGAAGGERVGASLEEQQRYIAKVAANHRRDPNV